MCVWRVCTVCVHALTKPKKKKKRTATPNVLRALNVNQASVQVPVMQLARCPPLAYGGDYVLQSGETTRGPVPVETWRQHGHDYRGSMGFQRLTRLQPGSRSIQKTGARDQCHDERRNRGRLKWFWIVHGIPALNTIKKVFSSSSFSFSRSTSNAANQQSKSLASSSHGIRLHDDTVQLDSLFCHKSPDQWSSQTDGRANEK
jgi:hypothetical protein